MFVLPHVTLWQAGCLIQGPSAAGWICWGLLPMMDPSQGPRAEHWLSLGIELGTGGGQRRACNRFPLKLGMGEECLVLPTEAPTSCSQSGPQRHSGSPESCMPFPIWYLGKLGQRLETGTQGPTPTQSTFCPREHS